MIFIFFFHEMRAFSLAPTNFAFAENFYIPHYVYSLSLSNRRVKQVM